MKKISLLSLVAGLFFLTSCDTTREITIGAGGDGTMITTMDMSQMIGIAKMSGQGKDLESQKAMDTTIAFTSLMDSIPDLTAEDKELLKQGSMNMIMNMQDDKFVAKLKFPFKNVSDIPRLQKLSAKLMKEGMKKQAGGKDGAPQGMPDDAMPEGSVDEYFTTTYTNGLIEMKLNKEKYAAIGDDKGMQALKEVGEQGLPVNSKIIINLPRPAKKVEGVNAKLSEDKKTLTIETGLSDFFDDATKMEFRVEY